MSNCKYCEIQKEHLKSLPENSYKYFEVDKDNSLFDIAESAGIENLPTILVFNENGQEIFRKEGIMTPEEMKDRVSSV